jgi:1,4-alpha-glucan branching enzyme
MTTKLRVAYIDYVLEADKPGRSGLSDIIWDMAKQLTNQGHQAHIIASYQTEDYPDERVIVHNFPTPPIGYRNILGQLWILKCAADVIKHNEFDILHSVEYLSTAVLATLGVSTSMVLTVPGNVYQRIENGHGFEWWFIHILKWATRISINKCEFIIAISSEMRNWWIATGSYPHKTQEISYGINIEKFQYVPNAKEILGLGRNLFILLYVGRFSKEKGINDLVEVLNLVNKIRCLDDVKIYLIGKGPQKKEIEQFIFRNKLENLVEIIDWINQDDLKLWYSAADLLIMPSWYEPAGRVVLEAMACGTPVISARTGAGIDHICHGKTGYLYSPGEKQELMNTINSVLDRKDFAKIMGLNAMKYIYENLTWEKQMNKIVQEVYSPIVSNYP